jgi:hypothetical protein
MRMIERIARALGGDCWETRTDDARRVLEAMRDIPEEMENAYDDEACPFNGPPAAFDISAWRKAIDAALDLQKGSGT